MSGTDDSICDYNFDASPGSITYVSSKGARKLDHGKAPLSMINSVALAKEAEVLAYGATKYARNNWKEEPVLDHSRLLDAVLRHVSAYADGEDNDPESGLSHLAHARCGLGFLLYYVEKGLGKDDR